MHLHYSVIATDGVTEKVALSVAITHYYGYLAENSRKRTNHAKQIMRKI
jgi:hypothetical protein